MVPGVKGHLILPPVEDIGRLVLGGHLESVELEASLQASDLELLERKLEPEDWFDAGSFGRLLAFADNRLGRRRREDWIELGRARFRQLAALHEFRDQLRPLENWQRTFGFFGMALWSSFYNFLRWELEPGSRAGSYCFEISGARLLPERERFRLHGFAHACAEAITRTTIHVSGERPSPGRIILRLVADEA